MTAANADLANRVARCAEESRVRLSRLWLGVELPAWTTPCPIKVKSGPGMGAGGETTFTFVGNNVTGWKMSVQGTEERILDSVVPHEVSHTIFATYFCCPVPRWIDEGAATSVEASIERNNYRTMLIGFLQENRGIPFNTMVRLTEYPNDMMPFYSQGFSVCEYLIAVGGHRRLVEFTREAIQSGDWSGSVKKYYGYQDLSDLQIRWTNWISAWHNAGHPAQLPAVAKIADYPYDIHGRPIGGAAPAQTLVAANTAPNTSLPETPNAIATVNPLNSFVAMPRSSYNVEDEDFSAAFTDGVGSTSPNESLGRGTLTAAPLVASAGNNVYQGTYGHRADATTPTDPPRDVISPAPDFPDPMRTGGVPTVLGQAPY
ncbi:MAG: hypothetical protein J6S40_02600 [Thermoguttaceae bacterium]|nr:hypothetical protein [Thermoguttaceae bacterium]